MGKADYNAAEHQLKLRIGGAHVFYLILQACIVHQHIEKLRAKIVVSHVTRVYNLLKPVDIGDLIDRHYIFAHTNKNEIRYMLCIILLSHRGINDSLFDVIAYHRRRQMSESQGGDESVYIFSYLFQIEACVWQLGICGQTEIPHLFCKKTFDIVFHTIILTKSALSVNKFFKNR